MRLPYDTYSVGRFLVGVLYCLKKFDRELIITACMHVIMTTLEILVILGYQVLACPEHGAKRECYCFLRFWAEPGTLLGISDTEICIIIIIRT